MGETGATGATGALHAPLAPLRTYRTRRTYAPICTYCTYRTRLVLNLILVRFHFAVVVQLFVVFEVFIIVGHFELVVRILRQARTLPPPWRAALARRLLTYGQEE
jgi:hypothetical protein